MMTTARTSTPEKSWQKRAAENMSQVQKLARALQSGVLKSELRTIPESVHAARALYRQIESASIRTKDFWVRIAYLTPDLTVLNTEPFIPGQESTLQASLAGQCGVMVGLAFGIRDLERRNWSLGARPFLSTPLVKAAFTQWMQEMYDINKDEGSER